MTASASNSFAPSPSLGEGFGEALVTAMRSGVVAVDNEGTQVFVNDGFCRMVGWSRAELVGCRPPFRYWPDEHRDEIARFLQSMLQGGFPVEGAEMVFQRRDGTRFPVLMSVGPIHQGGVTTGWVAEVVDVTTQKAQAEELQRREQLFRDLAEHLEEVFYVMDPTTPRILYVSPSYERVWGRSCASLYDDPLSFLDAVLPEHRATQVEALERQKRGEVTRGQYAIRRPDGEDAWIWDSSFPIVDPDGKVRRIVGMAADITAQKRDQLLLRRHEQQLGLVVDAARLGFWQADLTTGKVDYDRAWREMLGLPADAPDPDWFFFRSRLHPDDAERVNELMIAHIQGGSDRFEMEFRLHHQDGRWLWILSRGLVVERNEHGYPVRQIGTHQDISEHREYEAAHRQSERLESIGNLTSGIAHNFNNLLGVILGTLDRVAASPETTAGVRNMLATVTRAAESGAELTRSLLTLARRRAPNVERVDLGTRLRELQPILAASLPTAVRLSVVVDDAVVAAVVDRGQFDSSIVNLVVNARDAVRDGSHIRVSARVENFGPISPFVVRSGLSPGDWAVLSVADDGEGMDEDTLRHAFDPYFTTKGATGGTGLGLATVYAFCRSSGGVATIDSARGRGTTVEMYLPAAALESAPTEAATAAAATAAGRAASRGRILLVEDNEPLRDLARDALEGSGYEVVATSSVAEALALLAAGPFDVVFSDVMFDDGRSGLEIAAAVRARGTKPALVLTSGVPLDGEAAASRFLLKPYRIAELLGSIEAATAAAPA